MKLLSIQDISCVGKCSLSLALPIISACAVECSILPTAVLSTHTGGFSKPYIKSLAKDMPGIVEHLINEGLEFDSIYTGYLGSRELAEETLALLNSPLAKNAIKIVDPAMADHGKLYSGFDSDYVLAMTRLSSYADIILPNLTEACLMTGMEYKENEHNEAYAQAILGELHRLGIKKVILKGLRFEKNKISIAIYEGVEENIRYYTHKSLENSFHGSGDCFASVFSAMLSRGLDVYSAVSISANFVLEAIAKSDDVKDKRMGLRFEKALPFLYSCLAYEDA